MALSVLVALLAAPSLSAEVADAERMTLLERRIEDLSALLPLESSPASRAEVRVELARALLERGARRRVELGGLEDESSPRARELKRLVELDRHGAADALLAVADADGLEDALRHPALRMLALLQLQHGERTEALVTLRRMQQPAERFPEAMVAWAARREGELLMRGGEKSDCPRVADRCALAVRSQPDDLRALHCRAYGLRCIGRHEDGAAAFAELVQAARSARKDDWVDRGVDGVVRCLALARKLEVARRFLAGRVRLARDVWTPLGRRLLQLAAVDAAVGALSRGASAGRGEDRQAALWLLVKAEARRASANPTKVLERLGRALPGTGRGATPASAWSPAAHQESEAVAQWLVRHVRRQRSAGTGGWTARQAERIYRTYADTFPSAEFAPWAQYYLMTASLEWTSGRGDDTCEGRVRRAEQLVTFAGRPGTPRALSRGASVEVMQTLAECRPEGRTRPVDRRRGPWTSGS